MINEVTPNIMAEENSEKLNYYLLADYSNVKK